MTVAASAEIAVHDDGDEEAPAYQGPLDLAASEGLPSDMYVGTATDATGTHEGVLHVRGDRAWWQCFSHCP